MPIHRPGLGEDIGGWGGGGIRGWGWERNPQLLSHAEETTGSEVVKLTDLVYLHIVHQRDAGEGVAFLDDVEHLSNDNYAIRSRGEGRQGSGENGGRRCRRLICRKPQDKQATILSSDIDIAPSNGHAPGFSRCVIEANFCRTGRVGDIHHPQATLTSGDIGVGVTLRVTCGDSYGYGFSRRVAGAHLPRIGRVGDIHYPQATLTSSNVGVGTGHCHALSLPRCTTDAHLPWVRRRGDIHNSQTILTSRDASIISGHGYVEGIPCHVARAYPCRVRWRGDIHHPQTTPSVSNVGISLS